MALLRGEIYLGEMGTILGREIDLKRRPVVVLSINDINVKPLVVTVVPGGTRALQARVYRHEVKVEPSATNGLRSPTIFQCFQIKAIDHRRFDSPPVGKI